MCLSYLCIQCETQVRQQTGCMILQVWNMHCVFSVVGLFTGLNRICKVFTISTEFRHIFTELINGDGS